MRIVTLIVLSIAVSGSGAALGQSATAARDGAGDSGRAAAPEEVVVRGRRLVELRFDVEKAHEQVYAIFNQINSNDAFDVHCRDERKYHSRATQRVCRANFENRISGEAAREYMAALNWTCQPVDGTGFINSQACMFSAPGQMAKSNAQGVEGQAPSMHAQMNDEIVRLAEEDERFARAIIDWYEKNQQYEAARKRRND